ncbi:hypothetical protein VP01_1584g3 [Puccinia sorghi]|uniref:Uncharacterized protein n=1 Tax=Puccinia sorghi TaxID=27349 RepID=A0A0L6VI69_9BASI|nr:hypothetical protein VP01_1584g3 [Puccinia sorghi]
MNIALGWSNNDEYPQELLTIIKDQGEDSIFKIYEEKFSLINESNRFWTRRILKSGTSKKLPKKTKHYYKNQALRALGKNHKCMSVLQETIPEFEVGESILKNPKIYKQVQFKQDFNELNQTIAYLKFEYKNRCKKYPKLAYPETELDELKEFNNLNYENWSGFLKPSGTEKQFTSKLQSKHQPKKGKCNTPLNGTAFCNEISQWAREQKAGNIRRLFFLFDTAFLN